MEKDVDDLLERPTGVLKKRLVRKPRRRVSFSDVAGVKGAQEYMDWRREHDESVAERRRQRLATRALRDQAGHL